MPNWADENGRYWYVREGDPWWAAVEIPHPPVTVQLGCKCRFCLDRRQKRKS